MTILPAILRRARDAARPDLSGRWTAETPASIIQQPAPAVEPAPLRAAAPTWTDIEPPPEAPPWDGQWTVRPPSTLAADIEAEHDAHVTWVKSLPNGGAS